MKLTIDNLLEKIKKSKSLSSIIKSINKNKDFEIFVEEKTSFLVNVNMKQRLFHIKNDLYEKQYCKYCNNELKWDNKYSKYKNTCGEKDCNRIYRKENLDLEKEQKRISKIKQTKLEKYGDENYNNIIKNKKTCLEKYGVEHYTKTQEYKDNMLEKHGYISPFELEDVQKKSKKTLLEKYGVDHNMKVVEFLENRNKTNIEKYGYETPTKNEKIKQKLIKTNIEKYGFTCPLLNDEIKNKSNNTLNNNYGVNYPLQSNIIREKVIKTCLERYGVEYWIQDDNNYEKLVKELSKKSKYKIFTMPSGKEYFIQGYEDVVLKMLLEKYDENDIIIKNSDIVKYTGKIYYEYENKKHKYYPDIYIKSENKIIEVKSKYTYNYNKKINELKKQSCEKQDIIFEFIILTKNEYKNLKNKFFNDEKSKDQKNN